MIGLKLYTPIVRRCRANAWARLKFNNKAWRHIKHLRCHYCGCSLTPQTATQDHKNPVSQGGKMTTKNIVYACAPCNKKKGSTPYKEFKANTIRKPKYKMPNLARLYD